MNKERYNQIIDEVYETYNKEIIRQREIQKEEVNRLRSQWKRVRVSLIELLSQEEFINKCKTYSEFSEKWGLKIGERELSWEERRDLLTPSQYDGTALNKYGKEDCRFGDISPFTDKVIHYWLDLHNIPTKLITITYNNETIESYE